GRPATLAFVLLRENEHSPQPLRVCERAIATGAERRSSTVHHSVEGRASSDRLAEVQRPYCLQAQLRLTIRVRGRLEPGRFRLDSCTQSPASPARSPQP